MGRVTLGSWNWGTGYVGSELSPGRGRSHVGVPEVEGGVHVQAGAGWGLTHLELHIVPALLRRGLLGVGVVVSDGLQHHVLHSPLQLRGRE